MGGSRPCYYIKRLQTFPSLHSTFTMASQSSIEENKAEIENFFDSYSQGDNMEEKFTDGEKEEVDISRSTDFYSAENSTKIGPLRCRLFYHPSKMNYFVFFMKENTMAEKDSSQQEIHMSISAQDMGAFKKILTEVCDEVNINVIPLI